MNPDQLPLAGQIYATARLCLNRLHRVEEFSVFEQGTKAGLCCSELLELPGCEYAAALIQKGSYKNARGVLRELIRDFSPRQ